MKNKKQINIVFVMTLIIFGLFLGSIFKIYQLKQENVELKADIGESIELVPCYLCDGTVTIQPVNDDFYIECDKCSLHTDYFHSKSELIKYWNKE